MGVFCCVESCAVFWKSARFLYLCSKSKHMEVVENGKAEFVFTTGIKDAQVFEFTVKFENSVPPKVMAFVPLVFEYEYLINEDGNLIITEKQSLWQ